MIEQRFVIKKIEYVKNGEFIREYHARKEWVKDPKPYCDCDFDCENCREYDYD